MLITILIFEAENAGDNIRLIFLHVSPLAAASPLTLYSSGIIGTLCCKDNHMTTWIMFSFTDLMLLRDQVFAKRLILGNNNYMLCTHVLIKAIVQVICQFVMYKFSLGCYWNDQIVSLSLSCWATLFGISHVIQQFLQYVTIVNADTCSISKHWHQSCLRWTWLAKSCILFGHFSQCYTGVHSLHGHVLQLLLCNLWGWEKMGYCAWRREDFMTLSRTLLFGLYNITIYF